MSPITAEAMISPQNTLNLKSKTYLDHLELRIGYGIENQTQNKKLTYGGEWSSYFHSTKMIIRNGKLQWEKYHLSTNGVRLLKAYQHIRHRKYNASERKKHRDHNLLNDELRGFLDETESKTLQSPWQFQLHLAEQAIVGIDQYVHAEFKATNRFTPSCSSIELYKEYPMTNDFENAYKAVEAAISSLFGTPGKIYDNVGIDMKFNRLAKWRVRLSNPKNLDGEIKFYPKLFGNHDNKFSGYWRLEIKVKLNKPNDQSYAGDLESFFKYINDEGKKICNCLDLIEEKLSFKAPVIDEAALRQKIKSICNLPLNKVTEIVKQVSNNSQFCPSSSPADGDHKYTHYVLSKLSNPTFGIFIKRRKKRFKAGKGFADSKGNIYQLREDWKAVPPPAKKAVSKNKGIHIGVVISGEQLQALVDTKSMVLILKVEGLTSNIRC